jgi:DNA-binding response OmpR family regulator
VSGDQYIPNIVAVDDDRELLKLIELLLGRIGAQAHTFLNGRDAVNFLKSQTPDLIILDLMLPDIDGLELLRQIRGQPRFENIPVLILSAKADPGTIGKGLNMGADAYVTKPYIANTLIDRVRLLLNTGRPPKSANEQLPPAENS